MAFESVMRTAAGWHTVTLGVGGGGVDWTQEMGAYKPHDITAPHCLKDSELLRFRGPERGLLTAWEGTLFGRTHLTVSQPHSVKGL